jgi:cell division protein FtsB
MRRRDRKKYFILFICLFFILISIPRLNSLITNYRKLKYYNAEIEKLQAENDALLEKIKSLEEDLYYTEKILRENYGYIKEGEYVYRIEKE